MANYLIDFKDWITAIAYEHDVDPRTWGALFLAGKLLFIFFMSRVFKNIKAKKNFLTPLLLAGISYSLHYIYVIIAGRDIPIGIYLFMLTLFSLATYNVWKKVAAKLKVKNEATIPDPVNIN